MTALEVLIEQGQPSEKVRAHLSSMIQKTGAADLEPREAQLLKSALGELRQRESITRAGRRLAETLGSAVYAEMTSVQFFNRCYSVRSKLIHGTLPLPTRTDVDSLAASLEVFVADLLSAAIGPNNPS